MEKCGRYSYNVGVDIKKPWNEELEQLHSWLYEYGIADHIAKKMYEQNFLTEGDMASLIGIKSNLYNPYRYFAGDVNEYREKMEKELLKVLEKDNKDFIAAVRLQEALKCCPKSEE